MNRYLKAAVAVMLATFVVTSTANAQTRVAAVKDWSVFEAGEGGQKVCWIVSQPTSKTATRDGREVQVRRGDIFLMVAVRKADKARNEVSYLAGYPFKKGSKVKVIIGSKSYDMFTDGENAWTPSPAEDNTLTSAFRRGSSAKIQGLSGRGTTTLDTFSLSGFTAALKQAGQRCS